MVFLMTTNFEKLEKLKILLKKKADEEYIATYKIKSASSDVLYTVKLHKNFATCDCAAGKDRMICKHIIGIVLGQPEILQNTVNIQDLKNDLTKCSDDFIEDIKILNIDRKKKYSKRSLKGKSLIEFPENYIVLDIETTGLDPKYDEIIEISALKVRNNIITEEFSSLVKAKEEIDDFITSLTGITNEMVQDSPSIEAVIPEFLDFIGDDIIIGHNINFDINFLFDNTFAYFDKYLSNDFVDLMRLTRKVLDNLPNQKLKTIAKYFNINTTGMHRGYKDCRVTLECYLNTKNLIDNKYKSFDTFKNLFTNKGGGIDISKITAQKNDFNEDHLLFNKLCVFTGKLEKMQRQEAMQKVIDLGGNCANGINKETNFLIIGSFDYVSSVKNNKSTKVKKAEKLILDGLDLQILSESVFYDLLEEY